MVPVAEMEAELMTRFIPVAPGKLITGSVTWGLVPDAGLAAVVFDVLPAPAKAMAAPRSRMIRHGLAVNPFRILLATLFIPTTLSAGHLSPVGMGS